MSSALFSSCCVGGAEDILDRYVFQPLYKSSRKEGGAFVISRRTDVAPDRAELQASSQKTQNKPHFGVKRSNNPFY